MNRYVHGVRKSEEDSSLTEVKTNMKLYATDVMAGAIIASKEFPKEKALPRFFPLPFNNFGHYYLFDHARFLHIIYQTVMELKKMNTGFRSGRLLSGVWALGIALLTLVISTYAGDTLYPVALLAGLVSYPLFLWFYGRKLNRDIASHKAQVADKLLRMDWKKNSQIPVPGRLSELFRASGDAEVGAHASPVLIMFTDEQPFPGFGSLQLDNKFICRPKDATTTLTIKDPELWSGVIEKLKGTLYDSGIRHVGFGKVIVINHDSIAIDSPWLDRQKVPMLYQVLEEEEGPYGPDELASVRVYFTVEILFPEYESAACFFIRPFKTANAAGCHVAITTIGPPVENEKYIRDRLARFHVNKNRRSIRVLKKFERKLKGTAEKELAVISEAYEEEFHEFISAAGLQSIDPLEEKDYDVVKVEKKIKEIIRCDPYWPGRFYFWRYNLRERRSLTMGGDFFGYPELIGAISTIYDQLSKVILEAIEKQGFDITNYKDKDGKLSIKADSIDKLFIGEVINMKGSGEDGGGKREGDDNKKRPLK